MLSALQPDHIREPVAVIVKVVARDAFRPAPSRLARPLAGAYFKLKPPRRYLHDENCRPENARNLRAVPHERWLYDENVVEEGLDAAAALSDVKSPVSRRRRRKCHQNRACIRPACTTTDDDGRVTLDTQRASL